MRILGIIPARGGSKRLLGKNLKLLGGKPLVVWAIENSLRSNMLDKIIVSSDSQEILDISEQYNNEKVIFLKRPDEISGDRSQAIEYINHSVSYLKEMGEEYDLVVLIQPTSPLTLPLDIDNTIKLLIDSNSDSAVSVVKQAHDINPLKMKILKGDLLIPFIEDEKGRMSEDEMPDIYVRNGSVYVSTIELIESGRIIGDDCRGYVMPRERSVDINDEFDLDFAEYLFTKQNIRGNNV